ncbi:MAG: HEAT repeat domain-containing protein [Aggregatilineales bacterium]
MSDFDEFDDFNDSADADALIERFEKQVVRNMKIILSRKMDTAKRVEAAYWLGESGAPKAISALRKVYRGEKDPKVKAAVTFALGQFKAMDLAIERDPNEPVVDALARPENEEIYELLTDITLKGKFGKRKRISASVLRRLAMFLTFTLIIFGSINLLVLLSTESNTGVLANLGRANTGSVALDTLADLHLLIDAAKLDAEAIQTGLSNPTPEGLPSNCTYVFEYDYANFSIYEADPLITSATFPRVFNLKNTVNSTLGRVNSAYQTYKAACDNVTPPTQTDIDFAVSETSAILEQLPDLDEQIAELEETLQPTPTPPPTEVTEEATPEPANVTPSPEPTPTIDPAIYTEHRRQLVSIINRVNEPTGALVQLEQVWTDAANAGQTRACSQPIPFIAEDYIVPDDVVAEVPLLGDAAQRVNNLGLALLRQGWTLFMNSCSSGTLSQNSQNGLIFVETARSAFDEARTLLNQIN